MHALQPPCAFDLDLEKIQTLLLSMGGLVEAAIGLAFRALDTRDDDLAAGVVHADKKIDALEAEINALVVHALAQHRPQAGDLRAVIGGIKMAGDLERLGDYAKNMAKRVPVLAEVSLIEGATVSMRRQARLVRLMLKDALDAFARTDTALAQDVILRDVEVDEMTNALFREFLTHMTEDPHNITACMHYLFIAKNLERMGDHVTEICEQVIYLDTGALAEDRPKGASTATVIAPQRG